ncbi:MAG TPA: Crp/Fnr family transcriptional regulator [Bauldia sp.]|nr:Crp/Fnr family transcriptional regulator [Bauldia sp.]
MPSTDAPASRQVPCERCPLRGLSGFRAFTPEELAFVSRFKRGELRVAAGTTILSEGNHSEHLYTVLSGWGFRYKMLENGERQILNFVMPGDLIGLQASLDDKMGHSVEALSDALLCVFERGQLFELYRNYPGLAFDVTWLAAREERMLDEHLLSIGRRTARQRAAYLIYFVFSRAAVRGMTSGRTFRFPLTQRHIADALGLSLVHTNRVLNQLVRRQALSLTNHVLRVNPKVLAEEADWEPDSDRIRPYI